LLFSGRIFGVLKAAEMAVLGRGKIHAPPIGIGQGCGLVVTLFKGDAGLCY
jgi:hypothetical protein